MSRVMRAVTRVRQRAAHGLDVLLHEHRGYLRLLNHHVSGVPHAGDELGRPGAAGHGLRQEPDAGE